MGRKHGMRAGVLWLAALSSIACNTADEGALPPVRDYTPATNEPDPSGPTGDGDSMPTGDGDQVTGDGDTPEPTPDAGPNGTDPDATPGTACAGGSCWWSGKDASGCATAGAPTMEMAPKGTEAGDVGPIYLAWSRLWIGQTTLGNEADDDAWQGFGFDLDGTCSNSGTCGEAEADLTSCKTAGVQLPFDGNACRDNTFARNQPIVARVPELGEVFGLTEEAFNCSLHNGAYTQIIRITGYNGKASDESVRLDFYASSGLVERSQWVCPEENFARDYPLWLASSQWYIDGRDLTAPIDEPGTLPDSKRTTVEAFVKDGYLVAFTGEDFLMHLPGDNASFPGWAMTTQQGIITGKLIRSQDGTWILNDGLMGGRMKNADLLSAFHQIGVCPEGALAATYRTIDQYVTDGADLLADGSVDPEATCDSMSLGIAFEARPVTPGPEATGRPLLDCCDPANVDSPSCPVGCGDGRQVGSERCDTGIPDGQPGACPTQCVGRDACHPRVLADEGCNAYCMEVEITALQDGDGCCPAIGNAATDSDCVDVCGNGVVEPNETCDPPGSCPSATTCTSADVCKLASVTGDANTCDAVCTLTDITSCQDGDGCCPSGCNNGNDKDCPLASLCGNGKIDQGETCDGNCPSSCNDNNACTADTRVGSSSMCNVRCVNQQINACVDGDGCCPSACNSVNDSDCGVQCGNGIVEAPSEECDDGNTDRLDGCYDCKLETPAQQCNWIIESRGDTSAACRACQCDKCADEFLACTNGPNTGDNALCGAVIQCGVTNGCSGTPCYCTADQLWCLWFGPNGPCVAEVEAAARTTEIIQVNNRKDDVAYPIGRANAVSTCTVNNCNAECFGN